MSRVKMTNCTGVKTHIAEGCLIAEAAGRAASIPGCVFLGAADIGRAKIKSRRVWISWGRNLPPGRVPGLIAAGLRPIWCGADDGSVEVVIPDDVAAKLLRYKYA